MENTSFFIKSGGKAEEGKHMNYLIRTELNWHPMGYVFVLSKDEANPGNK